VFFFFFMCKVSEFLQGEHMELQMPHRNASHASMAPHIIQNHSLKDASMFDHHPVNAIFSS